MRHKTFTLEKLIPISLCRIMNKSVIKRILFKGNINKTSNELIDCMRSYIYDMIDRIFIIATEIRKYNDNDSQEKYINVNQMLYAINIVFNEEIFIDVNQAIRRKNKNIDTNMKKIIEDTGINTELISEEILEELHQIENNKQSQNKTDDNTETSTTKKRKSRLKQLKQAVIIPKATIVNT